MVYRAARPAERSSSARRRGGSRRSLATECWSSPARRAGRFCGHGREKASADPTSWGRLSAAPGAAGGPRRRAGAPQLTTEHELDERAAENLLTFLREQEQATGVLPSDQAIVVEPSGQIGDWRICILSPFGARVHAPWALALAACRGRSGSRSTSSGRTTRSPCTSRTPMRRRPCRAGRGRGSGSRRRRARRYGTLRGTVPGERGSSAPDPAAAAGPEDPALATAPEGPGAVAGRPPLQFPVVLETYREFSDSSTSRLCRSSWARCSSGGSTSWKWRRRAPRRWHHVLFDYVATYMYEDDTPLAERRAQALALDQDLLRGPPGQEELRDLIDPDALDPGGARAARLPAFRRRAARSALAARRPRAGRVRPGSRSSPKPSAEPLKSALRARSG